MKNKLPVLSPSEQYFGIVFASAELKRVELEDLS
jgi:hypothetical protein